MIKQTTVDSLVLLRGCATLAKCSAPLDFHVSPVRYHPGPVLMAPESYFEALSRDWRSCCFAEGLGLRSGLRVIAEVLVPHSCRTRNNPAEKGRFLPSRTGPVDDSFLPTPTEERARNVPGDCYKSRQLICHLLVPVWPAWRWSWDQASFLTLRGRCWQGEGWREAEERRMG